MNRTNFLQAAVPQNQTIPHKSAFHQGDHMRSHTIFLGLLLFAGVMVGQDWTAITESACIHRSISCGTTISHFPQCITSSTLQVDLVDVALLAGQAITAHAKSDTAPFTSVDLWDATLTTRLAHSSNSLQCDPFPSSTCWWDALLNFTVPTTGTYVLEVFGDFTPSLYTISVDCSNTTPPGCTPNSTTLCLSTSRFKVSVAWQSPTASGNGNAISMTADTGYFWFFSSGNVETIVKVLDGTTTNGHFWVFAAGLTNVQATITVTDTKNGAVKTYTNPQGTAFQPVQDTLAFIP